RRIGRTVPDAERLESARVEVHTVVRLLQRDRIIGRETIELFTSELAAAVREWIDRPAADGVDPLAGGKRLRARGNHVRRLLARFDSIEAHLVRPRGAGSQQVHVIVDEAWNDRAPTEIDPARSWRRHRRDLLIGSDR